MDAPLGPTSIHNALTPRLQESLGVPATADQHPPPLPRPRPAPHPGCPPCRSRSQRSPSLQVSEWSGGVPDREWPFLSAGLSRVTVLCVSCSFYRHQNPFGTWRKVWLGEDTNFSDSRPPSMAPHEGTSMFVVAPRVVCGSLDSGPVAANLNSGSALPFLTRHTPPTHTHPPGCIWIRCLPPSVCEFLKSRALWPQHEP